MKLSLRVNSEEPLVGGSGSGVTSIIVSCVVDDDGQSEVRLIARSISSSGTKLLWKDQLLDVGDCIGIAVESLHKPLSLKGATSQEGEGDEEAERIYFELSRDAYFRLRAKYETNE